MPKKGNTTVDYEEEETQQTLTCDEVSTKKIYFKAREVDKEATQLMCFPKYLFNDDLEPTPENIENHGDCMVLVTEPIKMVKGGIPRHNQKYHGPDVDSMKRAYFYIPKNENDPNSVSLFKTIKKLDDWLDEEINVKNNKSELICYLSKKK
jgi:hypothetical protein